jgi:malate dehydrogenase (oxaloacetate-decarboxylating)(NADP+)
MQAANAGTDNEELLQSQFYVGSKHRRVRGEAYYELLDEFISAVQRRCATRQHWQHPF